MTRRVTLRIDCLTLPAGTQLDQAALSAALADELRRALIAGGAPALGPARTVNRVAAGPVPSPAPDRPGYKSVLAAAIARSLGT
jgi:hypothetical protein